jgi:hypothetical protein
MFQDDLHPRICSFLHVSNGTCEVVLVGWFSFEMKTGGQQVPKL